MKASILIKCECSSNCSLYRQPVLETLKVVLNIGFGKHTTFRLRPYNVIRELKYRIIGFNK